MLGKSCACCARELFFHKHETFSFSSHCAHAVHGGISWIYLANRKSSRNKADDDNDDSARRYRWNQATHLSVPLAYIPARTYSAQENKMYLKRALLYRLRPSERERERTSKRAFTLDERDVPCDERKYYFPSIWRSTKIPERKQV